MLNLIFRSSLGGNGPSILRTTNGGQTWIALQHVENAALWGVAFHGPGAGLAVGGAGTILRTRDAGATWTRVRHGMTDTLLRSVVLPDERLAIAVGYRGTILRTTDGGETWTLRPSGTTKSLLAVSFSDAKFGLAVGNGVMRVTSDGGLTWREPPDSASLPLVALAADPEGAYAVGAAGLVVRIERGGIHHE